MDMTPIIRSLTAALMVVSGAVAAADATVVPLTHPADPIRLMNGWIDLEDPARPAIVVDLENMTAHPIPTSQIWFQSARFYTRSEMERNGRKIWDCANASGPDDRTMTIAPGARVAVRVSLVASCQRDLQHEHFFISLSRIAPNGDAMWMRDPRDMTRLLNAAMPHD